MIKLAQLNQSSSEGFVRILGSVFEHSPWVAELAFDLRPFESVSSLHEKMLDIVQNSSWEQKNTLICHHPELAGSEAAAGQLTDESKNEQAAAGLNFCSADELKRLQELNRQYREKFGFPFIIAVKKLTRYDILQAIETRLDHSAEIEFETCIEQIGEIARFRLNDLIID